MKDYVGRRLNARCPYPDCARPFTLAAEHDRLRTGKTCPCPSCGRAVTIRDEKIVAWLEQEHARRLARQAEASRHQAAPDKLLLTAVLEDVRSLFNVGAMFRSADGAGFGMLHLCGITAAPPRKEIAKTSLGAEDHVAWRVYPSSAAALLELKRQRRLLVGLEVTPDSRPLSGAILAGALVRPLTLVVGNEVDGLSAEARQLCDIVCHLPMRGVKESLNVSVAFGIAAYAMAGLLDGARRPAKAET